jgi:hypothetical protein
MKATVINPSAKARMKYVRSFKNKKRNPAIKSKYGKIKFKPERKSHFFSKEFNFMNTIISTIESYKTIDVTFTKKDLPILKDIMKKL